MIIFLFIRPKILLSRQLFLQIPINHNLYQKHSSLNLNKCDRTQFQYMF